MNHEHDDGNDEHEVDESLRDLEGDHAHEPQREEHTGDDQQWRTFGQGLISRPLTGRRMMISSRPLSPRLSTTVSSGETGMRTSRSAGEWGVEGVAVSAPRGMSRRREEKKRRSS